MTLACVWIEGKERGNQPLCFASDSRTKPGPIDGVTKVVLFGREDLAGVWAGDYRYAALVTNHLDAVFTASEAMRRRDIDVARALGQASLSVQRHLTRSMRPPVSPGERNGDAQLPAPTTILVGGYSLVEASHMLFRLDWIPSHGQWKGGVTRVDPARPIFIGDNTPSAKSHAKQGRAHRGSPDDGWRMEPLLAIHNAIADPRRSTVGGSVQLAKAYMHGSSRAYGFTDSFSPGVVTVRATNVDQRASRELSTSGLVIDLSRWNLRTGSFGAHRVLDRMQDVGVNL